MVVFSLVSGRGQQLDLLFHTMYIVRPTPTARLKPQNHDHSLDLGVASRLTADFLSERTKVGDIRVPEPVHQFSDPLLHATATRAALVADAGLFRDLTGQPRHGCDTRNGTRQVLWHEL